MQTHIPHGLPAGKPYTTFIFELRENVEKSKFQKGFEPRTYRSAGKHANHTATDALLAMTYSIPLLPVTHCSCRHAIPHG